MDNRKTHAYTFNRSRRNRSTRFVVYEFLEAKTSLGVAFEYLTVSLILLSVITFVLGTVPEIATSRKEDFFTIETFTACVFGVEYVLRFWTVVETRDPPGSIMEKDALYVGMSGRFRWMFTYYSIVDILSFLPYFIDLMTPEDDIPATQFLRILRIERMLRVEGRLLPAFSTFDRLFHSKGPMFVSTGFVGLTVWFICSSLYYLTERHNPEMIYCPIPSDPSSCYNRFESIPSSMYFCLLNLFGEYPLIGNHSNAGKVVATFVAIFAVAVFAIPTGIIGSEFQQMIDEKKKSEGDLSEIIRQETSTQPQVSDDQRSLSAKLQRNVVNSNAIRLATFALVFLSTIAFYMSTCYPFADHPRCLEIFNAIEISCVVFFGVEYVVRLFAAQCDSRYQGIYGVTCFACTPFAVIDLISFAPSLLFTYATGSVHAPVMWRALSVLRLLKAERVLNSFSVFYVVVRNNVEIFMVLIFSMMIMWVFCSTLMYYTERNNPDWHMAQYYQSIPGAMWVTLLNLTGESPLCDFTLGGKIVTAFMGIFGVGVFAIPIGLFGAAWEDAVSSINDEDEDEDTKTMDVELQRTSTTAIVSSSKQQCLVVDWKIVLPTSWTRSRHERVLETFDLLKDDADSFSTIVRKRLEKDDRANSSETTRLMSPSIEVSVTFDSPRSTTRSKTQNGSHGASGPATLQGTILVRCSRRTARRHTRCDDVLMETCTEVCAQVFGVPTDVVGVHRDRRSLSDHDDTRYNVHIFIDGRTRQGSQFLDFIYLLILLTCFTCIMGTIDSVDRSFETWFSAFEIFAVTVFTIEYAMRLYAAPENRTFRRDDASDWGARLRFVLSFYSLVDLFAIVPFYAIFFFPSLDEYDEDLRMLRIFRLLKLENAMSSFWLVGSAMESKRDALFIAIFDTIILWTMFTVLLYLCEVNDFTHGPDEDEPTQSFRFRNAPNSLEYTMIHLTGDFPLIDYTLGGRIVCFFIVFAAVGVTSVPQGLIANGFTEMLRTHRIDMRRKRSEAATKIERVLRGYIQRKRFKKLAQKMKAIKMIESAYSSTSVRALKASIEFATRLNFTIKESWVETRLKAQLARAELRIDELCRDTSEHPSSATELTSSNETSRHRARRRSTIALERWEEEFPNVRETPSRRHRRYRYPKNIADVKDMMDSRAVSNAIMLLIAANILLVLMESMHDVKVYFGSVFFDTLEAISVMIFSLEYAARLYASRGSAKYLYSRWSFVISFFGLVDVVSILPWYVMMTLSLFGVTFDAAIFRVFRIFRMLEFEKFVPAFTLLDDVYFKSKDVLAATGVLALIIWIGGSTLFYAFQPELFESIPNAMYLVAVFLGGEWGVIDYDIPNKMVTMMFCVVAIALFSIPIATLFEAFSDTLEDLSDGVDLFVLLKCRHSKIRAERTFTVKGTQYGDTVLDVKRRIEKVSGIRVNDQRLIFKGEHLRDNAVVGRLHMRDGSSVRLEVSVAVYESLRVEFLSTISGGFGADKRALGGEESN